MIHTVCWFSMIWQNLTKTEGHEMMRSNFHVRFTIIPHNNYGVSPKFQFRLNSTLKRCQTQSLVWWWLDQKGANSPNILHSHLYWHPTIHSCLAKISWSGFEHGSNADDNHCTMMHFLGNQRSYTRWLYKRIYKTEMKFWAVLGSRGCREKKPPNCHK